jgi:hypothetical protein
MFHFASRSVNGPAEPPPSPRQAHAAPGSFDRPPSEAYLSRHALKQAMIETCLAPEPR